MIRIGGENINGFRSIYGGTEELWLGIQISWKEKILGGPNPTYLPPKTEKEKKGN